MSDRILSEIENTLKELQTSLSASITDEKIEQLVSLLDRRAEFVPQVDRRFGYERDPNDEPYLNLAIASEADMIVSRDTDLLDLMTSHSDEAKDFRKRFRGIKIVDPTEFLKIMEKPDFAVEP